MVHLDGAGARPELRDGGQRHGLARGRPHVDVRECVGALPVAGLELHHDVVLVQRRVDGRHLALAERVVERLVDRARADAEPRGGRAVDDHGHLEPAILLVAADVAQLGHFPHGAHQAGGPRVQLVQVVALHGELVLRVADASAEAHILDSLEVERGPRHLRELRPESRDDFVRGDLSLLARFQRDEATAGVRGRAAPAAAAREQSDGVHGGVGFQDLRVAHHLLVDGRERHVLLGDDVGGEPPVVLLGEEALRHDIEEMDVHGKRREEDDHRDRGVPQRDGQASVVGARDGVEDPLAQDRKPRAVDGVVRPEQKRAHHRRGREGDCQ